MKTILYILIILVFFTFVIFLFLSINQYSYRNIYLGYINISGKKQADINKILQNEERKVLEIKINDKIYKYRYQDLGIILNKEKTLDLIFENNYKTFPHNYLAYFHSFFSQQMIFPIFIFTERFYQNFESYIFEQSEKEDGIAFNDQSKTFTYEENTKKYKIDSDNLKTQIIFGFGKKNLFEASLIKIVNSDIQKMIADYNQRLENIFNKSISIIINNNEKSQTSTSISPQDLKNYFTANYDNGRLQFNIKDNLFKPYLTNKLDLIISQKDDIEIDYYNLKNNLITLLNTRFEGENTDVIYAQFVDKPKSDGLLEAKYIEVNISKQIMYLWSDGENIARYRISSGLYNPTPVGKFKILNKALNAYSDIYQVWMPFWMAFYYDPKLKAYFGIHELPYRLISTGEQIRRPRDFIGSPHTGGCVSLDVGEAKKVYDWAEINTSVYVFD